MFSLENTRFFLEFSTNSRTEIAEPTGFDASHFTLQKETGRMGRDVLFSGETLEFNPTVQINGLTHQFPALIQRYDNKGFESDILFIIEINGTDYVIGQLDFANAETDRITYLRCSVIQDTKQAILKRHLTTKVDLYSNKDIYDNTITPLTPKKVLLNSLPLKQTSSWEKPADFNNNFIPPDPNILSVHWNPFNMITTSGIENTLSPKPTVTYSPVSGSFYTGFETLEAVNTLTNVQAKLSGCTWNFAYFPTTAWTHNIWFSVGFDVNNITKEVSYPVPASASGYSDVFNVPPMERGEKLYVFIRFVMGTPPNQDLNVSITQGSLTIDTTSTAVSSITDGIRLGDAFRQVIKSISGSSLNAPMFEASGDLYNQIIFKGNQLRLIQDKPFTVSFEDLLKQLPEINADYEVQPDGNIFIGLEDSFYTNNSCGNFPISPNAVFKESFSDKYKVNKVEFKYSKFEDGNNEEEENSLLSVHTEAQYPILNKQVENTKSIQVGMVRCAYLLEKTRKRNILITDNSAKSEDETIFIVDCIPGSEFKTETFLLKHFIDNSNRLILTNDGSFDFSLLGIIGNIISGTQVIIPAGFENEGLYRCASVSVTSLELLKLDSPPADFTGIKLTMLQYLPTAELKSRRDENITFLGIEHPTANMRFNIRQNLLDYYSKYLFTSHFYNDATIMKTAYFRSGADVYIRYSPIPIGAGFMIQDIERNRFRLGLVTPKIIETEVIATFTQFWACLMAIRTKRGYIQVSDTQGNIKQIYPEELDYDWRNFLLTIKGEEKR